MCVNRPIMDQSPHLPRAARPAARCPQVVDHRPVTQVTPPNLRTKTQLGVWTYQEFDAYFVSSKDGKYRYLVQNMKNDKGI